MGISRVVGTWGHTLGGTLGAVAACAGPRSAVPAPSATTTASPAVPALAVSVLASRPAATSNAAPPCPSAPEGTVCIPGGSFTRGVDDDPHRCRQLGQPPSRRPSTGPATEVSVSTFFLDETEVTVGAYRACVAARKCKPVRPLYSDFFADEQPMTGVTWYEAVAYCEAQGKRLPTEAEWERAARGPDERRTPFGDDDVTCESAVVRDDRGRSCGVRKKGSDGEKGKVLPVRSRPAGAYGLYDMMGNAEEWVADWWTESYAACGEACLGRDPRGPCAGGGGACGKLSFKVVRGGSWYWDASHATAYHRRRHFPFNTPPDYHHFGFRCALTADRE